MSYISSIIDFSKVCMPTQKVMVCNQVTAGQWQTNILIIDRYSGNADKTLPAGAYYVEIRNADPTGATIEVNGKVLTYGETYHQDNRPNQAAQILDLLPAITIIANGAYWTGSVGYPSTSGLTSNSIFL